MEKMPGVPEGTPDGVADGAELAKEPDSEGATEGVAGGSVRTGSRVPVVRAQGVVCGSPPIEEWLSACAPANSVPAVRATSRIAITTTRPVGLEPAGEAPAGEVRRLAPRMPPQRSRTTARDRRDAPPMRAILGWRKKARTVSCATRQATYPIGMAASPAGLERIMVVSTPVMNPTAAATVGSTVL